MPENKNLAEMLVKKKGPKEGTKEWLKSQLKSRSEEELEEGGSPEEQREKRKKKKLLDKLRNYGSSRTDVQAEPRQLGDTRALL